MKEENARMQRLMIRGPTGSLIAEQNRELKERVRALEAERDRYEGFFNQAQFEKKQRDDQIKLLNNAIVRSASLAFNNFDYQEMRVDSLCTRMGLDSEKSLDDPSLFLDLARLKDDLETEKKLRQKMADRVVDLEKLLSAEKKKTAELRFIRQNDNEEIIRLEK